MTTSADVREQLVDTLRLDLVGPRPGHEHEAEALEETPSRWYLTGFLVPFEAREAVADPTESETLEAIPAKSGTDDDTAPERTSARRGLFPSSMGTSVLVGPGSAQLNVTVLWGQYQRTDRRPEEQGQDIAKGATKERWVREQRREELVVEVPKKGGRVEREVPNSDGLKLVVHSKLVSVAAASVGGMPPGTRAVSVFLVNHREPIADIARDEAFAFQASLEVHCAEGFVPRPNLSGLDTGDEDEQVADLRYRDVYEWAVGHNVSTKAVVVVDGTTPRCQLVRTEWVPTWDVEKVTPQEVEDVDVGMEGLATCETAADVRKRLGAVVTAYGEWIERQAKTTVDGQQRQEVLADLMTQATRAKKRIESGLAVLESDARALEAFRLANKVMARQARQRDRSGYYSVENAPRWRLFQIAFIVMNLEGIVKPDHPDRDVVDLIFFPTGGGKTEAYLGLAAFTLVYRRLTKEGISSAGVTVLMRYTLRLLTLDQLSRAATLICALELERQEDSKKLGDWPFEIGLWVGQAATPNRMGKKGDKDEHNARTRVTRYGTDPKRHPVPIPLDSCPWCGSEFTSTSFTLMRGSSPDSDNPTSLRIVCTKGRRCDFNRDNPLPIIAVDDELYRRLPCFIIATIDKFAAMPWTGQTGALFGKVSRFDKSGFYGPCDPGEGKPLPGHSLPPPDLIVQDELHLISGPLGTIAGFYEAAIEALCPDGKHKPKVVASTATVRRARSQIQALFARGDVQVFPPPGPDLRDSFFAVTVPITKKHGRRYVGVAAQGRSGKVMLHRVYLALLAAAERAWKDNEGDKNPANPADPYMTLLGYFNSLRELGGSRRVVEDEVSTRLRGYGTRRREGETKGPLAARTLRSNRGELVVELTSRVSTSDVAEVKRRLSLPFAAKDSVDIALATNMISVGLDITRLGLMVVMGQPKTTAEYIQATSRVGRDDAKSGLVVTLLNIHKPRDRSHYERFESYHQSFYRSVEATSVTPFAPRAVDRALAGVVVALARLGFDELTPPRGAGEIWKRKDEVKDFVAKVLGDRAERHADLPPDEAEALRKKLIGRAANLLSAWQAVADQQGELGGLQYQREVEGPARLLHMPLDPERAKLSPKSWQQFKANRSLRDVEPTVGLYMKRLDESEVDELDGDEDAA